MMARYASRLAPLLALGTPLAGCGGGQQEDAASSSPAASARTVTVAGGDALLWGAGGSKGGVVLSHGAAFDAESWNPQAEEIAATGVTVLAVQDIAPESIAAAAAYLTEEVGANSVALIGASAGADATAEALGSGDLRPDQLILISPNVVTYIPGEKPKLFVASEDEPVADVAGQLAEAAAGSENDSLLLPGSAHAQAIFETDQGDRLLMTIIDRLGALGA